MGILSFSSLIYNSFSEYKCHEQILYLESEMARSSTPAFSYSQMVYQENPASIMRKSIQGEVNKRDAVMYKRGLLVWWLSKVICLSN